MGGREGGNDTSPIGYPREFPRLQLILTFPTQG